MEETNSIRFLIYLTVICEQEVRGIVKSARDFCLLYHWKTFTLLITRQMARIKVLKLNYKFEAWNSFHLKRVKGKKNALLKGV